MTDRDEAHDSRPDFEATQGNPPAPRTDRPAQYSRTDVSQPSSVRRAPDVLCRIAAPFLAEISVIAQQLVNKGWAEANAGNFSFRVSGVPEFPGSYRQLPYTLTELGNWALLTKKAGVRMGELADAPLGGLCLVRLNQTGNAYCVLDDEVPTSELPSHLAAHSVLNKIRPEHTRLLHTHPTALVALSLLYPEPESLVALLIRSLAEVRQLAHDIVALPFIEPGTVNLGNATARAFGRASAVIWPRHGMIASGRVLAEAMDLIEVCDKAAQIALLAREPARRESGRTRGRPCHSGRGRPAADGIETFLDVRVRDALLSPEEFGQLPRRPIHIVLDNLRSAFNVGSIFRLADAVRAAEVITCGYTCHPPHHKLEQAALGSTQTVPWRQFENVVTCLAELHSKGIQLVALETVDGARLYHEFEFQPPVAIVLGNEALGVSQSALQTCDAVIDIPVFGLKNSINVAAAAAVVLYDLVRRYDWLPD
ncbi:MAG: TrmH family RNA methyltransferase [candidate division WOR-3 bacterium]